MLAWSCVSSASMRDLMPKRALAKMVLFEPPRPQPPTVACQSKCPHQESLGAAATRPGVGPGRHPFLHRLTSRRHHLQCCVIRRPFPRYLRRRRLTLRRGPIRLRCLAHRLLLCRLFLWSSSISFQMVAGRAAGSGASTSNGHCGLRRIEGFRWALTTNRARSTRLNSSCVISMAYLL